MNPTGVGLPVRAFRAAVAALILVALLWAQALWQRHGILHGPAIAATPMLSHAAGDSHDHSGWPDHDAGDVQCRLLDQLSHADGLPCMPMVVLPLSPVASLFSLQHGLAIARWAALFQARAPPFVR